MEIEFKNWNKYGLKNNWPSLFSPSTEKCIKVSSKSKTRVYSFVDGSLIKGIF